jgi:hypothetical protein
MIINKNINKIAYCFLIIAATLVITLRYKFFLSAFFQEHFVSYKIELPIDHKFNVKGESTEVPQFIKHIISFAFPEYEITYDNESPAHLIVRTGYKHPTDKLLTQIQEKVPYLVYYPEKREIQKRRYRASGYPLHQFLTIKTTKENASYIPFVVYAKQVGNYLSASTRTPPTITALSKRNDLIYIFRHCVSIRDNFFALMQNYLKTTHSYGKCLNNMPEGAPGGYNELKNLYSKYKFVIAMEHAQVPGYLTEKITNAFEAQAVPIYWGDQDTVQEIFNKDAYIDLSDFKNFNEAAQYIHDLSTNYKKLQQILSAPVLTPGGEVLISINKEILPEKSKEMLKQIALKIKANYFKQIIAKKIF